MKLKNIGNVLIIVSILLVVSIYYPIALVYLFPPKIDSVINAKGYFIQIPKIHAQAPIVLNVNPWKQEEYDKSLKQGVALAKDTSLPGNKGTSYLFAHSSGPPWDLARFNTVFLRLGELKAGDTIIVFHNGNKLLYKVVSKKEIWPTDISFLKDLSKTQLVIQTCTPIGTDFKRLLVFATPI